MDEAEILPPTVPIANNVPMKLPAFWPNAAEVWFAQADTQFTIKAGAVLPQEVAAQILDLILATPARIPYKVLNDRLITLHSLNNYQRFEALVSFPLPGDQKPSHYLNRMLALLPDDYKPDFILQGLFLHRLPTEV